MLYLVKEFHPPNMYVGPMRTRRQVLAIVDRHIAEAPCLRQRGCGVCRARFEWGFGSFSIGTHQILLLTTSIWGSDPNGGMGTIIRSAPARDQGHLKEALTVVCCLL